MLAMLEEAPVTAVISGEELDTIIREAYVLGNHVRRKLVMALDAMYSGRLYITLGFSSIHDYAEYSIRCRKSETYDFLHLMLCSA